MPQLYCPHCGTPLRPNKGWAAQFYDGYCNTCDQPIEEGVENKDYDIPDERPQSV